MKAGGSGHAFRIGQKRDVSGAHVRLRGTVEERIDQIANSPEWNLVAAATFNCHVEIKAPRAGRRIAMQVEALLIMLLIGAVAGFLAGTIVKGYGFGVVGNIVVGIVGALIAGLLLPRIGFFTGGDIIGQIISATIGAVVFLIMLRFVRTVA